MVKICNMGICSSLHKEMNENGQTQKRSPKRLNIFILGDTQNSTSALATCSKLTHIELEVAHSDLWRSLSTYMSL